MREGKLIDKILGILLVFALIGAMIGGVANTVSATSEKTTIYVTDSSPWFTKGSDSGHPEYWQSYTYGGHTYIWTYVGGMSSNPSQPDCWAEFRPYLSQSGKYDVYACFYADPQNSHQVPHTIYHNGGSVTVNVNQYASSYFTWREVKLGTWDFAAGASTRVVVTDATGEPYDGYTTLNVDTIKFVEVCQHSCWDRSALLGNELAALVRNHFALGGVPQTGESIRVTAYAVAKAESGGNPSACGDNERSIGLWQINMDAHPTYDKCLLFEEDYNANAAVEVSSYGTNWNPWCTWENSACGGNGNEAYKQYLTEARKHFYPKVTSLSVSQTSITLGETVRIYYSVSDDVGLDRVELWRATDVNDDGQPDWPTNPQATKSASSQSTSGYFEDSSHPSADTYWYGIHVVDNSGAPEAWNDERNSRTGGSPGVYGPIQVEVEPGTYPPQVTTEGASSITTSSATLTGNLDSTGGLNCQVWFEYGISTSYGSSTTPLSKSSIGPFSAIISSLNPNTTYHFRACAQNSKGPDYGYDMTFKTAETTDPPTASFSADVTSCCDPLTVHFTDESTAGDNTIVSWYWEFGDGDTGTTQNPSHAYNDGTYTVSLTVTDSQGYSDTETKENYITSNEGPTAHFSADMTSGCEPLEVQFTDQSTAGDNTITSWYWNFDDEATSMEQNPSHTYNSAGTYTVSMTVTDAHGCSNAETKTVTVYSKPVALASSNSPVPEGATIQLFGGPAGMTDYYWTGPGGWTSSLQNPTRTDATTAKAGTYTLVVTNEHGCSDNAPITVSVVIEGDTTPPTVSSVSPQNDQPDVVVDTIVTATFSEAMDSSTINASSFTLAGSVVSGTVTYDPTTYTATFTPDANLEYDHTYTAILSTAIKDVAGNSLDRDANGTSEGSPIDDYSWSFTTESASAAKPVITSPLEITPEKDEYYVCDKLIANFCIENVGDESITFSKLLVGGRFNGGQLPNGGYPDFAPQSLTLNPGQSHQYEGTLELTEAGDHHFFCAYQTPDGEWNTSIDLDPGLTNEDRAKDINVLLPEDPYICNINPSSGAPGINVKIGGLNFNQVLFGASVNFGSWKSALIIDWSDTEIIVEVPPSKGTVEVTVSGVGGCSNPVTFTYEEPFIDYIEPEFGEPNTQITINGRDFGFETGLGVTTYVEFGKSLATEVPSKWKDDEIIVEAPRDYGKGAIGKLWKLVLEGLACYGSGGLICPDPIEYVIDSISDLSDNRVRMLPNGNIEVDVRVYTAVGRSNVKVFTYGEPPLECMHLASPGELRIYDSQGRVTGLVSGEVKEGVPNSAYFDDNTIVILAPSDAYRYEVAGTGEGTYGLIIASAGEGEATTFTATDIPISGNATHNYAIDWDVLSEGDEGVTVQADSDGDGVFENTFTSDSELTGEEFIPQSGCFIATAAYGTPMAEEIQILREFRDECLLTNSLGRILVNIYYRVSPPIADFVVDHPSLKPIVRAGLLPVVAVSTVVVDTTSSEKVAIVGLLVLISVAMAIWVTRRRAAGPVYPRR